MKFSFAASLAIMATETFAMFDGVEQLTSANWAETVDGDDENVWMVTFYADWCPYCESFEPELAKAIAHENLSGKKIRFGAVDVMANRELTQKYGIKRSPTVKMFGRDKTSPDDYLGQRKYADIRDYADSYANEHNYIYAAPEVYQEPQEDSYRADPYADVVLDVTEAIFPESETNYEEPEIYYEEPEVYYEEPEVYYDDPEVYYDEPNVEDFYAKPNAADYYEEPAKPTYDYA